MNNSKSGPIQLPQCHLDAIENIREKLYNAPIFPYPNPEYMFILDCDASSIAIGCELLQIVDGKQWVIAFECYSLTPAQRHYCTTRKELLAVIRFTRQFRHYLLGRNFIVRTDHNSLTWLMSFLRTLKVSYTVGQRKKVTAVTFFPARPRPDQRGTNTGQIRKVALYEITLFLVYRMGETRSQFGANYGILVCLVREIWQFKLFAGKEVTPVPATRGEGGYSWRGRRLLCLC